MVPLPSSFVVLVVATFAADSLDIGMAQHIAEQQMLDIDTAQHNAEMPPLQPNPPVWPDSVTVFGPDDAAEANAVMTRLSTTLNDRAAGHFSDERRAFLFKPGAYEMDVAVGYYVSVHGLGASPGDVVVAGPRGIYVDAMDKRAGGAGSLDTFWRSMENLERVGDLRWAVSQAAPLRRVRVGGDLVLHDGGAYASGGFLANAAVGGRVDFGSQQQWASRNVAVGRGATGGAWSLVYVGCEGVGASSAPGVEPRASVVPTTPLVAEKPFVVVDGETYALRVPEMKRGAAGYAFDEPSRDVPFERVFVADASKHGAEALQRALDAGLDVVLAPGVYELDAGLVVGRADAVWDGDGGVLSDVFARVGGPGSRAARADTMVRVAGAGVVLDNVWLWRADHAALAPGEAPRPGEVYHLVADGECYSETGLVVDGDDVVAYGLAVEHTLGDQMIWRGERGRVFFYQSELPYDVDQAFADAGHVGYRVTAAAHESVGAGIYSFFRDSQCLVPAAVAAPPTANFTNAVTKHLNGHPGILSVT
ncbi:hypothetical protein JL722_7298 [Aureococcus anophagefferens]|nr:hypothetical protein JL722_7298 [Aureococcus anophagefferens]